MIDIDKSGEDDLSLAGRENWEEVKKKLKRKANKAESVAVIRRAKAELKKSGASINGTIPNSRKVLTNETVLETPFIPHLSEESSRSNRLSSNSEVKEEVKEVVISSSNDEELGPTESALTLLKMIQAGTKFAEDLTIEERRPVVKVMRDQGRTLDEISAMLSISRRTIVNDVKWLREQAAKEVSSLSTWDLAGEIWQMGQNIAMQALAEKQYRTVSYVIRDMIEMLQSIGVVYKAPSQSKVAAITAHVGVGHPGIGKYLSNISKDRDKVINVLGQMMEAIEIGEVE